MDKEEAEKYGTARAKEKKLNFYGVITFKETTNGHIDVIAPSGEVAEVIRGTDFFNRCIIYEQGEFFSQINLDVKRLN